MRIWSVHEPVEDRDVYEASAGDRVDFVKDGFSWPGFVLSLPWLLYHRLWVGLLVYLLCVAVLAIAASLLPIAEFEAGLLGLLPALFVGLDGNDMRRRKLAGLGYADRGLVTARSLTEAEIAFFSRHGGTGIVARPRSAPPPQTAPRQRPAFAAGDREVLGLFPEPLPPLNRGR